MFIKKGPGGQHLANKAGQASAMRAQTKAAEGEETAVDAATSAVFSNSWAQAAGANNAASLRAPRASGTASEEAVDDEERRALLARRARRRREAASGEPEEAAEEAASHLAEAKARAEALGEEEAKRRGKQDRREEMDVWKDGD